VGFPFLREVYNFQVTLSYNSHDYKPFCPYTCVCIWAPVWVPTLRSLWGGQLYNKRVDNDVGHHTCGDIVRSFSLFSVWILNHHQNHVFVFVFLFFSLIQILMISPTLTLFLIYLIFRTWIQIFLLQKRTRRFSWNPFYSLLLST